MNDTPEWLRRLVEESEPSAGDARPDAEPRKGRILVIDDVRENRLVATGILTLLGYDSVAVGAAGDGIALLESEPFDLVLMDLFMPGMDGAEATRRIRALGGRAATVPVVGVSASVLPSDRRQCIESGMNDFISKPFAPAEIAPRLLNWIEGRPG